MSRIDGAERRLLIVDDDSALCRILQWCFEERGYRVVTASSCSEALAQVDKGEPDCALLDFHLPDGNGHCLSLALGHRLPSLTSILMSGDREAALAAISNRLRVKAVVAKPVVPAQLDAIFRHDQPIPSTAALDSVLIQGFE